MARPDNSVPPRPTGVPADARWDPKEPGFEWVQGELYERRSARTDIQTDCQEGFSQ